MLALYHFLVPQYSSLVLQFGVLLNKLTHNEITVWTDCLLAMVSYNAQISKLPFGNIEKSKGNSSLFFFVFF